MRPRSLWNVKSPKPSVLITVSAQWIPVAAARSATDIRRTSVVAPDNNRSAYTSSYEGLTAVDGSEPPLTRGLDYLRYNDILYVATDALHGLYVSYTEYHPAERCVTNTVAELVLDPQVLSIDEVGTGPDGWRIVFRSSPCLPFKRQGVTMEGHLAGGRMAFQEPSTILLTMGDFGFDGVRSDTPPLAQDTASDYGRVLAIDLETGSARTPAHRVSSVSGQPDVRPTTA